MIPSPSAIGRLRDECDVLDVVLGALAAGRTLPEALGEAAREHPRRKLRPLLQKIEGALRSGGTLGDAFELAGRSPALVAAARAGEASGRLDDALAAAESSFEARLELERRATDAWAEPLLTLAVAAAAVALLAFAGTLPRLLELLERPSLPVRLLHDLSGLPQPLPLVLALALIATLVATVRAVLRSPRSEELLEAVPIAGALRRQQQQALALREASVLVGSGMPVQDALDLSAQALPPGSSTRASLTALALRMRGGDAPDAGTGWPLLQALLQSPPPAARVSELLSRVAAWHEAEMDRLAETAAEAAAIVALMTVSLTCGTLIVAAWGGYFTIVTRAGG